MKKIIIKSLSKINFGLNIVGKRDDGFHNIETIFYPLSLCDIITFEKSDKLELTSTSGTLNNEALENNLIIKAVRLLENTTGKKINARIHLEKNIPLGAGLGGGSSNAASTLASIKEMFNLHINKEKLHELASQLGSDVPFFLKPIPSYAESRGEKLTPVEFEINKHILLINPGIHIPTKWAYSKIKPKPSLFKLSGLNKIQIDDFSTLIGKVRNDFEEVVFTEYPVIKKLKEELYNAGAEFVLMSGSGSSVFALFNNIDSLNKADSYYKEKFFTYTEISE
ncbi:MAG TPA: 4-(cytidine 5'-diphospho)-2-C-methyl-D-erythritol kinase [Ignavibacteriaceae bacterium]|jgi:4-diphosphocytidyl-2-C-methyl-D-erythritol kinase|nr:4-(cytidine 5'-diphospho)-2-C-methyl-D-erythritol kinase [Ignavibacteriaceae bacterium]